MYIVSPLRSQHWQRSSVPPPKQVACEPLFPSKGDRSVATQVWSKTSTAQGGRLTKIDGTEMLPGKRYGPGPKASDG